MEGVVFYTTFHMNVHALGKTKPPSGGSQGVLSTLATNKQTKDWRRDIKAIVNSDAQFFFYASIDKDAVLYVPLK